MAKTSYVDILSGYEEQFFKNIKQGDRFITARLTANRRLLSRKKKKGLTQKSLLPQISELWAGFSDEEKQAWADAGAECNLNGWRLFVQDQCARIVNGIPGVATPSLLHQCWAGKIVVNAPATEIKLAQLHPQTYWMSRKVPKKKSMYEPVVVTESFAFPLQFAVSYKSDLVAEGALPFARFFVTIWHSYQGVDIFSDCVLELDLETDWKRASFTVSNILGQMIGYNAYIQLHDVRGELLFDNVKLFHSGQNWARDPFCKSVNLLYTRAFYQIPKHWAPVISPVGSAYGSIYAE